LFPSCKLNPLFTILHLIATWYEWHQLKTHEIAGRMFEDEYDLALAIMDGMEARSLKGGYTLERFKFNSA